jgi:50S ribosomal subunit-associated GTPase HflX
LDKIILLKEKLLKIDKQMTVQRRNSGNMVRVALVGYTNVGKSTIMNLMLLCVNMDKMMGKDLQTGLNNLKTVREK